MEGLPNLELFFNKKGVTQIVTPYMYVIRNRSILSRKEKYSEINKNILAQMIINPDKSYDLRRNFFFTTDKEDKLYIDMYRSMGRDFNLTVVSSIVIDEEDKDIRLEYSPIKNTDIYYLQENIRISQISFTILNIINIFGEKFSKIAIICPSSLLKLFPDVQKAIRSKNTYIVDSHNDLRPDTTFVIDTMIDEYLCYASLGEAMAKTYYYDYIVSKNRTRCVYFRLITESSFIKLSAIKKKNKFDLYKPLIKNIRKLSDIEGGGFMLAKYYYETIRSNYSNYNTIEEPINFNVFPSIIFYKSIDVYKNTEGKKKRTPGKENLKEAQYKISRMQSFCFIIGSILNDSNFVFDLIEYNLTHEDSNIDYRNRSRIKELLYSRYGDNTSLLFYVNLIYACVYTPDKKIMKASEDNFINKDTVAKIYVNKYALSDQTSSSEQVNILKETDIEYQIIISNIKSLYTNLFVRIKDTTNYVDSEGEVYSIDQDRIIYDLNNPLPKKIIPLVIKDKFVYVWLNAD